MLTFVVALIISTVIIYYVAKFFGAKDSLTTAVLAALIGTAVYTIFYYVLGQGLLPVLQKLYTIGWLRAKKEYFPFRKLLTGNPRPGLSGWRML
ncbi:hypothetical protein [Methanoregula sp.]|uniref:hypothetical protein n=1 Tax=Methanoregula sp. TaxID=2052170 RepID=UPI00236BBDFF|nr:hypothetical protein [Methanoregula sp.]MDD1685475.1 hypothetical protein [Methanoregula sp.]